MYEATYRYRTVTTYVAKASNLLLNRHGFGESSFENGTIKPEPLTIGTLL